MLQENKYQFAPTLILFFGFVFVYLAVQWQFHVFTQPYFWDELGVYSRSSTHLYAHGLSLMPSAVPDELSRGHPLLCSFYFALAFKLFGCVPASAHFAAALLNVLGFYFCYKICLRYLPQWQAVCATLAIFVQPLFLSQSLLILPEMPLMVATLGAVMFYIQDKKWAVMICLVAALQIKESALILPVAFLLSDSMSHKKITSKGFFVYFLIPVLTFLIFIAVQKYQRGYYFYPLHTSLSSFDPYYIRERWDNFKQYFLYEQGRFGIVLIGGIILIIWLIKTFRKWRSLWQSHLLILPVTIAGALCFLVLNYYLSRYTMYFVVLIYILYVLLVKTFGRYVYLQWSLIILIGCNGIFNWNNGKLYTDVDFSYANHVQSLQMVVEELKNKTYHEQKIGMDFPLSAAYWSSENGYNTGNVQSVPMQDSLPKKDYLVFTHPGNMGDTIKYEGKIELRKEFRVGYAFTRIYKLRQMTP